MIPASRGGGEDKTALGHRVPVFGRVLVGG